MSRQTPLRFVRLTPAQKRLVERVAAAPAGRLMLTVQERRFVDGCVDERLLTVAPHLGRPAATVTDRGRQWLARWA